MNMNFQAVVFFVYTTNSPIQMFCDVYVMCNVTLKSAKTSEVENGGVLGNSCSYLPTDKLFRTFQKHCKMQKHYFLEQLDLPEENNYNA